MSNCPLYRDPFSKLSSWNLPNPLVFGFAISCLGSWHQAVSMNQLASGFSHQAWTKNGETIRRSPHPTPGVMTKSQQDSDLDLPTAIFLLNLIVYLINHLRISNHADGKSPKTWGCGTASKWSSKQPYEQFQQVGQVGLVGHGFSILQQRYSFL